MNKNKSKKYREAIGGALTGNQLYGLIRSINAKDDSYLENKINLLPLDANDNILYNDVFRVYFNPINIRFIAVHRGTDIKNHRDWFNNVRNMFFLHSQSFITIRNLLAKSGHETLKKFLIKLYKNKNKVHDSKKIIIETIEDIIKPIDNQLTINIEEAVEQLLKTKLTTVGYSQGSIYAYLYGNQGLETIVYNPAPYKGKKPDNTFIVKRKGDIFSMFSNNKDNSIVKIKELKHLKTNDFIKKHKYHTLLRNKQIFGNKFIFDHDNELDNKIKTRKNIQKQKRVTRKNIQKQKRVTKKNTTHLSQYEL